MSGRPNLAGIDLVPDEDVAALAEPEGDLQEAEVPEARVVGQHRHREYVAEAVQEEPLLEIGHDLVEGGLALGPIRYDKVRETT
jgi:hypothetical protein